jgi:signal peptidase II
MTTLRRLRGALLIAAVVVLIDQLTKHWAVNALADGDIDLVGSLRFNLAFNTGMAFSQGTGVGPVIGVVALLVVVGLLISIGRASSPLYTPAVGLIIGGAVGNLVDRLFRAPGWFRGGVVDFIDVQWWPIFNVADICVTVGGTLLLLSTLRAEPPPTPEPAADGEPSGTDDDVGAPVTEALADRRDDP